MTLRPTAAELEEGATAYRRLVQLVGVQALLAVTARLARWALAGSEGPQLAASLLVVGVAVAILLWSAATAHTLARRIGVGPAWLWSVALAVPGLGIAALLYLHPRAAAWCRRQRIELGLLGPTAGAVTRLRVAGRVPRRNAADRLLTGLGAGLAAVAVLLVPARAYLAPAIEYRRVADELRGEYTSLTALAPEAMQALFDEAHGVCFRNAHRPSWTGGALDRDAHLGCLDDAFQERLGRVLVLEAPQWEDHSDPGWEKLGFAVRVVDGALPPRPTVVSLLDCGDGRPFRSERPTDIVAHATDGPRGSALVPRRPGPCRLAVSLAEGRWSLGAALNVETPAPAPAAATDIPVLAGLAGVPDAVTGPVAEALRGLPPALVDPLLRTPSVSLLSWSWLTPGRELKLRVRSDGLVSLADYLSALQQLPECELAELQTALPESPGPVEVEIGVRLRTPAPNP